MVAQALGRGWPVHTTYGLTEACGQVTTARPDEVRQRPGTAGQALPGVSVRIVDEDGADVPAGTVGQIVVDGPTLGRNLHGPADGPLKTGDSGRVDADGFLFTVGRRADLIVTGGKNVDPAEVEGVLRSHPSVAEACVVGLDDPEWGSVVAAALVTTPGAVVEAGDLEALCRTKLGGHQVPRRFLVLKRLPRTPAGKLDHAMVRRWIERQMPSTRPV
jgi:acyl-CoA synthetase (AMP-forming)/AMP-acid ligase II